MTRPAAAVSSARPCRHGPITAETARRLAADSTWRRLLTDPATGALPFRTGHTYQVDPEIIGPLLANDQPPDPEPPPEVDPDPPPF